MNFTINAIEESKKSLSRAQGEGLLPRIIVSKYEINRTIKLLVIPKVNVNFFFKTLISMIMMAVTTSARHFRKF